uniref:(northern house mosquito) hypothetical protein n=1 Tax=Culex pipiens TaxID=7175 RepID=A0A8D8AM11_CULPI
MLSLVVAVTQTPTQHQNIINKQSATTTATEGRRQQILFSLDLTLVCRPALSSHLCPCLAESESVFVFLAGSCRFSRTRGRDGVFRLLVALSSGRSTGSGESADG